MVPFFLFYSLGASHISLYFVEIKMKVRRELSDGNQDQTTANDRLCGMCSSFVLCALWSGNDLHFFNNLGQYSSMHEKPDLEKILQLILLGWEKLKILSAFTFYCTIESTNSEFCLMFY